MAVSTLSQMLTHRGQCGIASTRVRQRAGMSRGQMTFCSCVRARWARWKLDASSTHLAAPVRTDTSVGGSAGERGAGV